jgi:hypothetical protein
MSLTKQQIDKLNHINSTMSNLHSQMNEVYEHWVDEEYDIMKSKIKSITQDLKKLLNGIQEEY